MTTDIEISSPAASAVTTYGNDAMDRLGRWVQQADAVFALADRICSTSFAPAAYRGKPAEAAAAMLAGAELGFDPMASLRAFDSIQGVPAPKAITLRAVVQGQGHEIRVIESTAERAVVAGRRKGDAEWNTPSIWDIERAKKLPQYKSNPNYQTNPTAMLLARATSEQCRWIASDAIMGMPYSAEEIGDHPELAPSPVVRRLTVADLDEQPALEAPAADEPDRPEVVTRAQQRHVFALWGELGLGSKEQRHERLMRSAEILGLPDLETFNNLTSVQADQLITELGLRKAELAGPAEVPGGES